MKLTHLTPLRANTDSHRLSQGPLDAVHNRRPIAAAVKSEGVITIDNPPRYLNRLLLKRRRRAMQIILEELLRNGVKPKIMIVKVSSGYRRSPPFSSIGPTQLGPMQVGPTPLGPTQVGPTQLGPTQLGPTQLGPTQVGEL